jgi:hypothetical protein
VFTIHRAFRHVAKAAAKGDKFQSSLLGVNVRHEKDGRIRMSASDGKRLLTAVSKSLDPADLPAAVVEGMGKRKDGVREVTLPAKEFVAALKDAPAKGPIPALRYAVVSIGPGVPISGDGQKRQDFGESAKLGTTDLSTTRLPEIRGIDAKFPAVVNVIPPEKEKPRHTAHFNARLLGETLIAVADMLGELGESEADSFPVRLDFFADDKGKYQKLVISAGPESDRIAGVIMGLDGQRERVTGPEQD